MLRRASCFEIDVSSVATKYETGTIRHLPEAPIETVWENANVYAG